MEILSLPTVSVDRSYLVWQSLSIRCFLSVAHRLEYVLHISSADLRNYLERFSPESDNALAEPFIPHHQRPSGTRSSGKWHSPHLLSLSFPHNDEPPTPYALPLELFLASYSTCCCRLNWFFSAYLSFQMLSFMKTQKMYIPLDYFLFPVSSPKVGSLEQRLRAWSGARLPGSIDDSTPAVCANSGKLFKLFVLRCTCLKNRYFSKSVYLLGKIK